MITFESTGDFEKTDAWIKRMSKMDIRRQLTVFAERGVSALASATPVESGATAAAWGYEIISSRGSQSIIWTNSNVVNGAPIAIMLQYGHGTGTGGYIKGRDYINPAMQPIFDKIAADVWKAVTAT